MCVLLYMSICTTTTVVHIIMELQQPTYVSVILKGENFLTFAKECYQLLGNIKY